MFIEKKTIDRYESLLGNMPVRAEIARAYQSLGNLSLTETKKEGSNVQSVALHTTPLVYSPVSIFERCKFNFWKL